MRYIIYVAYKQSPNIHTQKLILYNDSEAPSVEFTGGIYTWWNLLACLESFFQMRKLNPLSYAIISHYNFQTLHNNFFLIFLKFTIQITMLNGKKSKINEPTTPRSLPVCMHALIPLKIYHSVLLYVIEEL